MIKAIQQLIQKYWEQLMYLVFGVLTTLVNMVVFFGLDHYTTINYLVSNTIAWFLSVLFAFFTNKTWVFQSKYTTLKDFSREMASFFFLPWYIIYNGYSNDVCWDFLIGMAQHAC